MILHYLESVRAYRPDDDIPDHVVDRALAFALEGVDPHLVTEYAVDFLEEREREHGIKFETGRKAGPFWNLNPSDIALQGSVDDLEKFLASPACSGLSVDDKRRIRYVDREGGVYLSIRHGGGSRHASTVATADFGHVDYPSPAIDDALRKLEEAWEEYVSDVAHRTIREIEADVEYQTSWERLREDLREMGEVLTEDGRSVPESDCAEEEEEEEEDPDE